METIFLVVALLVWFSPNFNKLVSGTMYTIGYIILNSGLGILHPDEKHAYVIGFLIVLVLTGVLYLT